jgi:hypothetical protein
MENFIFLFLTHFFQRTLMKNKCFLVQRVELLHGFEFTGKILKIGIYH